MVKKVNIQSPKILISKKHFEGIWNPVMRKSNYFSWNNKPQNFISIFRRGEQMKCLFSTKHVSHFDCPFQSIWIVDASNISRKICANLPRFYQHIENTSYRDFVNIYEMFWDLKRKLRRKVSRILTGRSRRIFPWNCEKLFWEAKKYEIVILSYFERQKIWKDGFEHL